MQRAVEMLGGGTLGLVVGYFLCIPLIAHVFGPTTVAWDASTCPPGIYTITSTATSQDGLRQFSATTQQVQLPRGSVIQDFGEIPIGQYRVTALARDATGRTFNSNTQTVTGEGPSPPVPPPAAEPTIPVATPVRNRGHQEPVRTSVPERPRPPAKASTTAAAVSTVRMSAELVQLLRGENGLQKLLVSAPSLKSVAFLDHDDDGEVDAVRIEWVTGEVRIALIAD